MFALASRVIFHVLDEFRVRGVASRAVQVYNTSTVSIQSQCNELNRMMFLLCALVGGCFFHASRASRDKSEIIRGFMHETVVVIMSGPT